VDYFQSQQGVLCADGVPLTEVAERFGTPTYVYSERTLLRHVAVLQEGLKDLRARICYAVKANGNLALLKLLGDAGCHFDAVSLGELLRVAQAGQALEHTILSGVGKTDDEIRYALGAGVLYLSVESHAELVRIGELAAAAQTVARVSLRVNPDVDARTHPYISTGMAENKFGVPIDEMPALVDVACAHPNLELVGLTCHIGSQITELAPFEDAADRLVALTRSLMARGLKLTHVGMGGGLGIPYQNETPPDPAHYGAVLARILGPLNLEVVLEPGRVLVGNAGILLTRVVRQKTHGKRHFVLVDAGMNDLLRPALYAAHHAVEAVAPREGTPSPVHVVGPVCESADTFAKNCPLPPLQPGDLIALRSAGAYGFVMASHYNGRPNAAEVLCRAGGPQLIRRRETHADLWRHEVFE
jgi:diaminopimelate decarboxylase